MKKKPLSIRVAWIGFSAALIAAIIYGLFTLFSPNNDNGLTTNKISVDKNQNSPVSSNVEHQTNIYYQSDTDHVKKIPNNNNDNKGQITKSSIKTLESNNNSNNRSPTNSFLNIENMSGGVAIGKIENLNINSNKPIEELLPFAQCVEVNLSSDSKTYTIEIKAKEGEWSPLVIGIPYNEKKLINPEIYDTKSSAIPGITSFQSSYAIDLEQILEIKNKKVKYWLTTFQTPILTKTNSIFIKCKNRPSNIICGIYPDKIFLYYFDD